MQGTPPSTCRCCCHWARSAWHWTPSRPGCLCAGRAGRCGVRGDARGGRLLQRRRPHGHCGVGQGAQPGCLRSWGFDKLCFCGYCVRRFEQHLQLQAGLPAAARSLLPGCPAVGRSLQRQSLRSCLSTDMLVHLPTRSLQAASDIISPVSGEIVAANEELASDSSKVGAGAWTACGRCGAHCASCYAVCQAGCLAKFRGCCSQRGTFSNA